MTQQGWPGNQGQQAYPQPPYPQQYQTGPAQIPPKKSRKWVPVVIVGLVVVLVAGGVTGWLALRAAFDPNRDADQRPQAALLWEQRPSITEKPLSRYCGMSHEVKDLFWAISLGVIRRLERS